MRLALTWLALSALFVLAESARGDLVERSTAQTLKNANNVELVWVTGTERGVVRATVIHSWRGRKIGSPVRLDSEVGVGQVPVGRRLLLVCTQLVGTRKDCIAGRDAGSYYVFKYSSIAHGTVQIPPWMV